ncbi:MAG: hypothetical protein HC857_07290 [Synechococcales cyanobacterium RU_4_20]|nr:hypothetical protein [Synechococcales cyanobacterium RU_4_20]
MNAQLRQHFRDRLAPLNLGLEHRLGDRMGLLSGGQRQAICLLMATLAEHKICFWMNIPPPWIPRQRNLSWS